MLERQRLVICIRCSRFGRLTAEFVQADQKQVAVCRGRARDPPQFAKPGGVCMHLPLRVDPPLHELFLPVERLLRGQSLPPADVGQGSARWGWPSGGCEPMVWSSTRYEQWKMLQASNLDVQHGAVPRTATATRFTCGGSDWCSRAMHGTSLWRPCSPMPEDG